MSNLLRIGKRLIPMEQVALFEPYVQNPESPIRSNREFKSRIVLLDRDSVLSETAAEEMAEIHSFRLLRQEQVATNPAIRFGVEDFVPAEGFTPSKEFLTRLSWHDLDGNSQSKLLLTSPEEVLSIVVRGEVPDAEEIPPVPSRRRRKRAAANRTAPTP